MHSIGSFLTAALAAATFITTVNAHMIMKTPKPFPFKDTSTANGPLLADGSNFPCKQTVVFDPKNATAMPIGSQQSLTFTGSAVHGGGSCQISLTTDKTPTKSSKWMVIHSIIGGCPSKTAGVVAGGDPAKPTNLPETQNDNDAFLFTIPDGIATGDYVLAWTWFNNLGNREMYMNCAPVTVTGGTKKRHALDTGRHNIRSSAPGFSKRAEFPEMFVANIGSQCQTASGILDIPNPGASVERIGPQSGLQAPVGCSAKSVTPDSGAGSGGAGASHGTGGSPNPTGSAPASSPLPSAAGGVFNQGGGSGTSPAASSPAASSPVVVSISPIGTTAPAPASPPPSTGGANSSSGSSGSSGSAAAGSQPCDTPGVEVCSADGTKIGMCDVNKMAIMGPVASGTKCSGGAMVAARSEHPRRFKFARGHIRRHTRGGLW